MNYRKLICLLLCAVLLCTGVQAVTPDPAGEVAAVLGCGTEDILKTAAPEAGDSVPDWMAFTAGRTGNRGGAEEYLNALWDYVSGAYQENGGLHGIQATIWHRVSLTVLALGADPTCFGEDADGNPIDLIADGTYNWHMSQSLGIQGTNAWIYALIALDASGAEVPADAKFDRDDMIQGILAAQLEGGGFHFGSGSPDPDMTAMALQALAPYRDADPQVGQAVEAGLDYLAAQQTAQGDFGSAESCAQVILALCALGIDPDTDPRFLRDGGSAADGLLLYRASEGGFSHQLGDDPDTLATAQAALALTALQRLREGKSGLYDFTHDPIEAFRPTGAPTLVFIAMGAAAAVIVILIFIRKGKKTCTR